MESPLLQPVPTPQRRIVAGTHQTKGGAACFSITRVNEIGINAGFGMPSYIGPRWMNAADLRELAELFADLANALDGK